MRSNKNIDYYYKSCDMECLDELERKQFEYYNDYGYNTGSSKRRVIDSTSHAKKIKYQINKTGLNSKF